VIRLKITKDEELVLWCNKCDGAVQVLSTLDLTAGEIVRQKETHEQAHRAQRGSWDEARTAVIAWVYDWLKAHPDMPFHTPEQQFAKLLEEMREFVEEPSAEELADVMITFFIYEELAERDYTVDVLAKNEVNRNRTWHFDEEAGTYHHD